MTKTAAKLAKLRKLSELSKEVAKMMKDESPVALTIQQEQALSDVLRSLDIHNYYELGDKLRMAFQYELDAVGYHNARR
jgi:hypothetical protein